jgi:hypothetical protein
VEERSDRAPVRTQQENVRRNCNLPGIDDGKTCLLILPKDDGIVVGEVKASNVMIDGLKLTVTGEELRALLQQRIDDHLQRATRWKREQARTSEEQTDETPLLPDHICENEAERHEWQADVLGFIREHIESSEVYRLGQADLAFGELLPDKPGWLEQDEYEERTSIGFHLGRLTKTVGELTPAAWAVAGEQGAGDG